MDRKCINILPCLSSVVIMPISIGSTGTQLFVSYITGIYLWTNHTVLCVCFVIRPADWELIIQYIITSSYKIGIHYLITSILLKYSTLAFFSNLDHVNSFKGLYCESIMLKKKKLDSLSSWFLYSKTFVIVITTKVMNWILQLEYQFHFIQY